MKKLLITLLLGAGITFAGLGATHNFVQDKPLTFYTKDSLNNEYWTDKNGDFWLQKPKGKAIDITKFEKSNNTVDPIKNIFGSVENMTTYKITFENINDSKNWTFDEKNPWNTSSNDGYLTTANVIEIALGGVVFILGTLGAVLYFWNDDPKGKKLQIFKTPKKGGK